MFKKIKKIYFKIYHLLKLLGVFIIIVGTIPIVKADVTTCDSYILIPNLSFYEKYGRKWFSSDGSSPFYFPNNTSRDTIYYFKILTENSFDFSSNILNMNAVAQSDTSVGFLNSKNYSYNSSTNVLQLTTAQNNSYETKRNKLFYNSSVDVSPLNGSVVVFSTNLSDIENCTLTGGGAEPEGNEVYNNFITMYVEKIKYLAEGFTSNSYLLAMIGIIISWIVLELFLKVFHLKGGKK